MPFLINYTAFEEESARDPLLHLSVIRDFFYCWEAGAILLAEATVERENLKFENRRPRSGRGLAKGGAGQGAKGPMARRRRGLPEIGWSAWAMIDGLPGLLQSDVGEYLSGQCRWSGGGVEPSGNESDLASYAEFLVM